MAPTIRIDDQVYFWLQKNAKPFEDTPNSVLRRVAGLEESSPSTTSNNSKEKKMIANTPQSRGVSTYKPGRIGLSGKQLNKKWGVGARHALFNKDGAFYENLKEFPGALFDTKGYLLFRTEEEYRQNPHLKITKKTNVNYDIASIPGYVKKE